MKLVCPSIVDKCRYIRVFQTVQESQPRKLDSVTGAVHKLRRPINRGESLSPFLFFIYLNDIEDFILNDFKGIDLGPFQLFLHL